MLIKLEIQNCYDAHIHFLGGMAAAYFFHRAIQMAPSWLGYFTPLGHFAFAYACACTTVLFWEFAELASDRWAGSRIQYSVFETLYDLIFGALGALVLLLLASLARYFRSGKKSAPHTPAGASGLSI